MFVQEPVKGSRSGQMTEKTLYFHEYDAAFDSLECVLDTWDQQGVMVSRLTSIKAVGLLTRHMVYVYRIHAMSHGKEVRTIG